MSEEESEKRGSKRERESHGRTSQRTTTTVDKRQTGREERERVFVYVLCVNKSGQGEFFFFLSFF